MIVIGNLDGVAELDPGQAYGMHGCHSLLETINARDRPLRRGSMTEPEDNADVWLRRFGPPETRQVRHSACHAPAPRRRSGPTPEPERRGFTDGIARRMTRPPIRIAVDIGGTFTDLELFDGRTRASGSLKAPTTPDDPARGLVDAIAQAGERFGFEAAEIGMILHGTTIATNAVLTRDLPEGALLTNDGFEDVLEIGRHARTDIYALRGPDRRPLVPRRRRFGVGGRIGADGAVVEPLTDAMCEAAAERVATSGAAAVAICLLNAFANPAHETALAKAVRRRSPDIAVSCSHRVSPEMREFERTATTVLNALLVPVMARYVAALERRLAEAGITAPIYLIQSNGGAIALRDAVEVPAKLLLSGPSGGVLAAERLAARLGRPDIVAVDMGGTSYDIAVVAGGRRSVVTQGEIDGLPVRLPMVEMTTIGAGGGSIASVDPSGRLQVGPRSAGAMPGPVCYGRGGTEPTVTDANLLLGRLDAASFLGGAFALDLEGARAALQSRICVPLGLDADRAATGILAVVEAKLAARVKLTLYEKGLDPRDFALMSFGGAGGLHAVAVAVELGIGRVIFPRNPSTFSAHGILQSDILHDLARSRLQRLDGDTVPELAAAAAEMLAEGAARLEADGVAEGDRTLRLSADLRYRGQAFELSTPFPEGEIDRATPDTLRARFEAIHRQRFAFDDPSEAVELVTLRLTAAGALGATDETDRTGAERERPASRRRVHVGGSWRDLPVHDQASLPPGRQLLGPAVIEQDYTTILIPQGWRLQVESSRDLIATDAAGRTHT